MTYYRLATDQYRRGQEREARWNGLNGHPLHHGCDKPIDCCLFVGGNEEQRTRQSAINMECNKLENSLVVSGHFGRLPGELLEEEEIVSD